MSTNRLALLALAGALGACELGGTSAPSVTMPSRASHSEHYFPITSGTAHADASCDQCHGTFETFRKFDCVTCHAGNANDAAALEATHADESGFPDLSNPDRSVPSADCYVCHADGSAFGIDPAVHAPKFPIGAGTAHAAQKCSDCHVNASDRKVVACAGCHTSSATAAEHTQVKSDAGTGYAFDTGKCLRCHGDGQVDRVAAHLPFAVTAGKHGPLTNGECLSCHPALRADKPRAANFGVKDCLGCHEQTETNGHHVGESGYAYTTAKCLECHPNGVADGDLR